MLTSSPSPWWRPESHQDRRSRLLARNEIRKAFRRWFRLQDFVEIDTACLQVSPGNEAHLHAFETEALDPSGVARPYYLRTSPEFACKKLLAAGEARIYEFGRAWRNRERGPLHHPEFMMLEWYRADEPYEVVMRDCMSFVGLAAETAGALTFSYRGRVCDPYQEPERVTVAEAFERYAGLDLLSTVSASGETDRDALAAMARGKGIRVADDDTWSDVFSRVLVEKIETKLGLGRPTILYEYPITEAALARTAARDPRVAERFELYCSGVELANAFGELTDPKEQRRRFELEMAEKLRVYGHSHPIDEDLLEALGHMPQASGCALGFDRLAMLVVGADRVDQVMWTPLPE